VEYFLSTEVIDRVQATIRYFFNFLTNTCSFEHSATNRERTDVLFFVLRRIIVIIE